MQLDAQYIFQSTRLGFRNWVDADLEQLASINADPEVMRFFPSVQTLSQTQDFILRMKGEFAETGFCYFAVDVLASKEMIGFIGLHRQTFVSDFTPCIDIGWRLARQAWGLGYAVEGAQRVLDNAFEHLGIPEICAIAPIVNVPSVKVMQKIGMLQVKIFQHPLLAGDVRLAECVLYKILNTK
jgi:RimJ/RimL family protein N-acetyltransferase